MSWTLDIDLLESCSCAALCPCTLGPAKPDQGWCSAVFGINITSGSSEGVDLSGMNIAIQFELPGDFLSGIDKARLYVDPSASDEQRAELDAVFHGERGGLWGGMKEAIKEWLPTKVTGITLDFSDTPGLTLDGVGQVTLQPISLEDGTPTTLENAPILGAFSIGSEHLAYAQGSSLSDPDLRAWESLGQGGVARGVVWAA
jgi:hypothetical protein